MMNTQIKTLLAAVVLTALIAGPASAMVPKGNSNPDLHALIDADLQKIANVENGVGSFGRYFGNISDRNADALQAVLDKAGVERVIQNPTVID